MLTYMITIRDGDIITAALTDATTPVSAPANYTPQCSYVVIAADMLLAIKAVTAAYGTLWDAYKVTQDKRVHK